MSIRDSRIESLRYLEDKLEDTFDYVRSAREMKEEDEIDPSAEDISDIIDYVKTEMQKMTIGAHRILTYREPVIYEESEDEWEEDTPSPKTDAYLDAVRKAVAEVKKQFNIVN